MKISKPQIEFLAKEAGITIEKATKVLKHQLWERLEIDGDNDQCWGFTVAELICANDDVSQVKTRMIDIEDAVAELGFKELKSTHVEAFLAARIMGDGDCPNCGGQLEWDCKTDEPYDWREINAPWLQHSEWDYCPLCGYDSRDNK